RNLRGHRRDVADPLRLGLPGVPGRRGRDPLCPGLLPDRGDIFLRTVGPKGADSMKRARARAMAAFAILGLAGAAALRAHITPPVVLLSERDAVTHLLAGARKFSVLEVRLTPEERQAIRKGWNWKPTEDFYRFYMGRSEEGKLLGAVIFVTDFTIH